MTLEPISRPIYLVVRHACNVMLILQVVLICYAVFARFVLNNAPAWVEEFSLLFMVWFCLLSPAEAIKEKRHLAISILQSFLPSRAIRIVDLFNHTLILLFAVFMATEGMKLAELTLRNIMPGMGVSATWLYTAVPVSGVIIALASIERILAILSVPGENYVELECNS
ncbi:TRAP-type C4-dicarboxylate transport system, small permease component [Cohaesibacter sp. ES.047]|uniref:TRAP transporter small permease n=1 Tax=Cohaesibacter sp. ES.047 TaxID=1798205 RepID=UPI000BBFB45D|nr:TRAP transporter small permease [Cohaesibacter sp. ES.047]SNY90260.1 TRAP-type C4-dicarboxylate transport system, small permease component [Cohaesibacter sp. ES.047]